MKTVISQDERDIIENALTDYSRELRIDIVRISGYLRNELQVGVNWYASGTQNTTTTRDFIAKLKKACKVAEWINDQNYIIDYDLPDENFTRAYYLEETEKYLELLKKVGG